MIKKIIILALLFSSSNFISSSNLSAQLEFEWAKRDSGTKAVFLHYPNNVYVPVIPNSNSSLDTSGNIYIAGYTNSFNPSQNEFIIIKLNQSGELIWRNVYNFNLPNTNPNQIQLSLDNKQNICTAGNYFDQLNKFYILKHESNGKLTWSKIFIDSTIISFFDIIKIYNDSFDNIYIITRIQNNVGEDLTCKVFKFNPNGVLIWSKVLTANPGSTFMCYDSKIDNLGNVYLTGSKRISNPSGNISFTSKLDSSGNINWIKELYNNSRGISLSIDNSNTINTLVIRNPGNSPTFAIAKYDDDGSEIWVKNIDTNRNYVGKICNDKFGSLYVGGRFGNNYCLYKFDNQGNMLWKNLLPTLNYAEFRDMTIDKFSNVYYCGYSYVGSQSVNGHYWVTASVKPDGNLINYITHNGILNSFCFPNSINVFNKNVYVSGYDLRRPVGSYYSDGHYDLQIVKYSQLLNLSSNTEILSKSIELFQNYPNPFNPTTSIKFNLNKKTLTNISVYDIRGVKISELVNSELNQGEYEYNWDASNFPSGIYFYKLTTDSYQETRKMILLK